MTQSRADAAAEQDGDDVDPQLVCQASVQDLLMDAGAADDVDVLASTDCLACATALVTQPVVK